MPLPTPTRQLGTSAPSAVGRRAFMAGGLAAVGLAAVAACSTTTEGTPHRIVKPNLRFGLDISVNKEKLGIGAKYRQLCLAYDGTLGAHTKFFDASHGWAAARMSMVEAGWGAGPGEVRPVLCAKVHNDDAFNQLMTHMAAVGQWTACFWQEVNDDIRDGAISVSEYRAVWLRLDALRKAHPNGSQVRLLPIMNSYVLEDQSARALAGGYDAVGLCQGLPIDGIGFDVYDSKLRSTTTWSPDKNLGPAKRAAAALGVTWSIPEFGVQVSQVSHDDEQGRADRLQAVIDYCRASPTFGWLNYWEGQGRGGDWSLIGTPAQKIMQAAMNAAH